MAGKSVKLSQQQKEEILGILLLMLGMLVLASLISYDPAEEPQGIQFIRIHNAMGVAGVYISYVLIKILFGYSAILIPIMLIAWGWLYFRGHQRDKMGHATYLMLLAAFYFATWLGLPHVMQEGTPTVNYSHSGLIGAFFAHLLHRLLGAIGSVIVLLTVGAVTLMVATQKSLHDVLRQTRAGLTRVRELFAGGWIAMRDWRPAVPQPAATKASWRVAEPEVAAEPEPETVETVTEPEEPRWKKLARLRVAEGQGSGSVLPGTSSPPADSNNEKIAFDAGRPAKAEAPAEAAPAVASDKPRPAGNYVFPPLELLSVPPPEKQKVQSRDELLSLARVLEERLLEFDVEGKVVEINPGPVITRYEYEPAPGIKVSRITALADDLALAMRAKRIRIVAPIPGKAAVGIELPNSEPQMVDLRSLLDSDAFRQSPSPLTIALGKTISGQVYVTSLERMPHLLIAGATGSGKSVCLNAIIASILYKAHPRDVQFVLVDPKRLELSSYRMLRRHHLNYRDDLNEEVVTTPQNALAILRSLEWEMENRYTLLARVGTRNIAEYNQRLREGRLAAPGEPGTAADEKELKPLPYIVLVIDELADLMLTAAKEVEEPIARLTQLSRAVGIHLIVATQRPSVDVITGVIKANFPARIAFQVASKIDSRTILDMNGAEKLLGSGDMLFLPPGSPEAVRIHGAYVSSEDIERTIEHIRNQPAFDKTLLPVRQENSEVDDGYGPAADGRRDELFHEALKLVVRHQQGSISLLQRRLKIGYSRAARLIDELEAAGIVGAFDGSKAREVLVDESYLEEMGLE
ncbi:MAG: DNA translocase FtsK 4TM domain-containing protein [candidate division KSB1 bacterium]|nr:DNA translocase FtsK 4TM domain-containing protein [candidate division KSB1 bacterium]MDZ7276494.1 DNA translocase FtsK 4TM domain-containing protein [candidate division KSB1 bacterium]MDZ7286725.1 DNA translocase FtsK 4TM domain-containing protein [candidate division KSB1 bacterium]MDZ7300264.1 DNA translocase FtsK 4TM domain-containing protein [candidate division KSB1 bacterium]MDZ7308581.1 DNA translocase FtsK 4TM domain-containing protein [candidate division KSB1 bacterium]